MSRPAFTAVLAGVHPSDVFLEAVSKTPVGAAPVGGFRVSGVPPRFLNQSRLEGTPTRRALSKCHWH